MNNKPTMKEFIQNELNTYSDIYNSRIEVLSLLFSDKTASITVENNYIIIERNTTKTAETLDYSYEPLFFYMDSWGEHTQEKYRKLLQCKNKGFKEELIYFCEAVENYNLDNLTLELIIDKKNITKEQRSRGIIKVNSYKKYFQSWKDNLHIFKKDFAHILCVDKIKNF